MGAIHKFPFSICYADTDAGGIVYHGRYIEIAERARMNWLHGVATVGDDVGFVVRELSVKYLQPLKLGEDLIVESEITKIGAASLGIEQKFVRDGDVCAIINLTAAYIGADMKPKRIPDELAVRLA